MYLTFIACEIKLLATSCAVSGYSYIHHHYLSGEGNEVITAFFSLFFCLSVELCYCGEHSASDFGMRLPIINTNLHPILHRFQGIAISNITLKTRFFGLHFCCRTYRCIFNHFYLMGPKSYRIRRNNAK